MNDNSMHNLGKQIGDTVRSALQSGDLTKLSEIGTAVQNAVQGTPAGDAKAGEGQQAQGGGRPNASPGGQAGAAQTGQGQPAAARQSQQGQNTASGRYTNYQNAHRPAQTQARAPYSQQRPSWMGNAPTGASNNKALVPKGAPGAMAGLPAVVFGVIGGVTFGTAAITVGILAVIGTIVSGGGLLTGIFAVGLLGSLWLAGAGSSKRKLALRVRKYYELLAPKGVCKLEELGTAAGRTPAEVKKDIRKAMRKGMMPDVRMDVKETCAIWGEENYKLYLDSEKARREREKAEAERAQLLNNPDFAAMEAFKADSLAAINKIKQARGRVADEAVAKQMGEIEQTAGKIFGYVEAHPEKLPDTRKYMSYYLPTTIKVMEKYSQYERMEVRVPSVVRAMDEIEQTLGTIDTAFQNLLESLYHEETMDVSTDMQVLQNMLEQEGLTGQAFKIEAEDTILE